MEVPYTFYYFPILCSEKCRSTEWKMAGQGEFAVIDNIRRDEKNKMVGDTLHMVANLWDPKVN